MQQIKAQHISVGSGYKVGQSLLFDTNGALSIANPFASDGDATRTNTISFWVKLAGNVGGGSSQDRQYFFSSFQDSDNRQFLGLDNDGHLWAYCQKGGEVRLDVRTSMKLIDQSAWYHIVQRIDTYDEPEERCQLYVNSELADLQSHTPTEQDKPLIFFGPSSELRIGSYYDGSMRVGGYMAEIYATAGNNLDLPPSNFALTDDSGVYNPIPYTGTYGTNGFYLPFEESVPVTEFKTPGNHSYTVPAGVNALDLLVVGGGGVVVVMEMQAVVVEPGDLSIMRMYP